MCLDAVVENEVNEGNVQEPQKRADDGQSYYRPGANNTDPRPLFRNIDAKTFDLIAAATDTTPLTLNELGLLAHDSVFLAELIDATRRNTSITTVIDAASGDEVFEIGSRSFKSAMLAVFAMGVRFAEAREKTV